MKKEDYSTEFACAFFCPAKPNLTEEEQKQREKEIQEMFGQPDLDLQKGE